MPMMNWMLGRLKTPKDEKKQELDERVPEGKKRRKRRRRGRVPVDTTSSQPESQTLKDGDPKAVEDEASEAPQDEKLALDESDPVGTTNSQTAAETPTLDSPKAVKEETPDMHQNPESRQESVPDDNQRPSYQTEGTKKLESFTRKNFMPRLRKGAKKLVELRKQTEVLEEVNDKLIEEYYYIETMVLIMHEYSKSELEEATDELILKSLYTVGLDESDPVGTTNSQTAAETPTLDHPKAVEEEPSDMHQNPGSRQESIQRERTKKLNSVTSENFLSTLREEAEKLVKLRKQMEVLEEANDKLIEEYYYTESMVLIMLEYAESEMIPLLRKVEEEKRAEATDELILKSLYTETMVLALEEYLESEMIAHQTWDVIRQLNNAIRDHHQRWQPADREFSLTIQAISLLVQKMSNEN